MSQTGDSAALISCELWSHVYHMTLIFLYLCSSAFSGTPKFNTVKCKSFNIYSIILFYMYM